MGSDASALNNAEVEHDQSAYSIFITLEHIFDCLVATDTTTWNSS